MFVRQSGAPLSNGIPGFFTRDGYLKVFLPQLQQAVRDVRKQSWIYGAANTPSSSESAVAAQVTEAVSQRLHHPLDGAAVGSAGDAAGQSRVAVQVLNGLTGPDSLLRRLLLSVAANSDLNQAASGPGTPGAKDPQAQHLAQVIAAPSSDQGTTDPSAATPSIDPLLALHDMTVGQDGQPAQLDVLLKTLDALYQQVSRSSGATPQASSLLQAQPASTMPTSP